MYSCRVENKRGGGAFTIRKKTFKIVVRYSPHTLSLSLTHITHGRQVLLADLHEARPLLDEADGLVPGGWAAVLARIEEAAALGGDSRAVTFEEFAALFQPHHR